MCNYFFLYACVCMALVKNKLKQKLFDITLFHAEYSTNTFCCSYIFMYLIKKPATKYTKLVYFQFAKLELILCLMHFNCAEVVLKSN